MTNAKYTYYEFKGFRGKVKGYTYYGTKEDLQENMELPKSWKVVKEVDREFVNEFRFKALENL